MKLIRSVIRPSKVEAVKEALCAVSVASLTVTQVIDHGPTNIRTVLTRGYDLTVDFAPLVEIDLVVHDDDVDHVVGVILKTARTAANGDGHVTVTPVEHRYSIHTGLREVI